MTSIIDLNTQAMRSLSPHCAPRIACWALLLALTGCVADAKLTVQAHSPQASSSSRDESTKTWTIRASDQEPSQGVRSLSINTLGTVFISYDSDAHEDTMSERTATRAIVRVTGDDQASVDAASVSIASTSDGGGQQKLQLYANRNDVTTEIILTQPCQVRYISALGHGDVVVGDQVLAASSADDSAANGDSSTIQIDVSGLGDVFVSTTESLKATSASFTITGSGNLQLEAQELRFEILTVKNYAASADIKMLSSSPSSGSSIANASFSMVTSGKICWDFPDLHIGNLEVSMAGSGAVGATAAGSCDTENVEIIGSGDVKLGTVTCQRAQVAITSSGGAVVQVSQYLGGVISGSGDVKYTGRQPLVMSDKYGEVGSSNPSRSFKAIAKPTMSTLGPKCTKLPVPSLNTQLKSSNKAPEPPPSDLPVGPTGGASHQIGYQPPVASSSQPICSACKQVWTWTKANSTVVIPIGVFLVFWIVVLVLSRRERRRQRTRTRQRDPEQQNLLGPDKEEREDKPVYI